MLPAGQLPWNPLAAFQQAFERGFTALRRGYPVLLATTVTHKKIFLPAFLLACLTTFLLIPWLGQDFFPV